MSVLNLAAGMYGPEVREVQQQLQLQGYDVSSSEIERSFFGPATRAALLRWQQQHGLPPTGVLDKATRTALAATVSATSRPSLGHGASTMAARKAAAVPSLSTSPGHPKTAIPIAGVPVEVMKADITSLLSTSTLLRHNQQLQAYFINRYAASTGTIQDFWKQVSNDPEFKAAVPELQFTLQLATLTLNNSPLVAAIRKQYNPKSVRDLTALSATNWAQIITSNNISIPASISGANPAEKTTNYVNAILSALRSAFPTDYIAQNLAVNPQDNLDQ